jgi:endonuclease/exonuclease/phosphatase family metal-dependent hydrolase
MKRLFTRVMVGLLCSGVFAAPALAGGDRVKVMTRNQYLGADLTGLIIAKTEADFIAAAKTALAIVAGNDFPRRARRLATEVAFTKPDLIGLQEVFKFSVNGVTPGPPFVDHLAETLKALEQRGQRYVVAATLENLDITIHIPDIGDVRVLDRDVILVRKGIAFTKLKGDVSNGGLCGLPIPNPVSGFFGPLTLKSTESEDGCNYTVLAKVENSPVGSISIERGFVAVDATVRGEDYRFVNTHLEVQQPNPMDSNSQIIQFLQSVELVGSLYNTPPGRKLILLGDVNSSPDDAPLGPIVPPYQIITKAGFTDIWDINPWAKFDPEGYTCCEFEDLSNIPSVQDERIDIVFVQDDSFKARAFVTGQVPIFTLDQQPSWASDHGGVFGKLIFK